MREVDGADRGVEVREQPFPVQEPQDRIPDLHLHREHETADLVRL